MTREVTITCSISRRRVSPNQCYPGLHWTFAEQHLQFLKHALGKLGPWLKRPAEIISKKIKKCLSTSIANSYLKHSTI